MVEKLGGFEPVKQLETVLRESRGDRAVALAAWKESYMAQRRGLAEIQAALIGRIRENPAIAKSILVKDFEAAAEKHHFSEQQVAIGKEAIHIFEERHAIIRTIRDAYPNDRGLFKAVFGISPIGPAHVEEDPITLTFVCSNTVDFTRALYFDESRLVVFREMLRRLFFINSLGSTIEHTRLPELKDMVVVRKGNEQRHGGNTQVHEEQHMIRNLLLAASYRVASAPTGPDTTARSVESLIKECQDMIERDLEDELLAFNKDLTGSDALQAISQVHYITEFIHEQVVRLQNQLQEMKVDTEPAKGSGMSKADIEKAIGILGSRPFRETLREKTKAANTAYQRFKNIGGFSHEQIAALLDLEPLGQWPKLAKRILGQRSEQHT